MTRLANIVSRLVDRIDRFLAEIFDEDSRARAPRFDEKQWQRERSRISWRKNLNNLS